MPGRPRTARSSNPAPRRVRRCKRSQGRTDSLCPGPLYAACPSRSAGTAQDLSLGFAYTLASQLQQRTMSNSLYTWAPATAAKTYSTDALNRYTAVSGASFNYDGRGNLTGDGTRIFNYD